MLYIIRNNRKFGPFEQESIVRLVEIGKVLKCDRAIEDTANAQETSVREYLKSYNIKPKIRHQGSILKQLRIIGKDLIFPESILSKDIWNSDSRLTTFAVVGLLPILIGFLPVSGFFLHYLVSLYFSMLWGVFFYFMFKTSQTKFSYALKVFFSTQVIMLLVWNVFGLTSLNPFYNYVKDLNILKSLVGYVFGVGFTEELVKAIPLFIISYYARVPLIPRTMVFYGLISGIAFGVFEGVDYQLQVNIKMEYSQAFFMNMLRLTSLPFLHATWTGMAGYFISFSRLYPRYRLSMYFLCISIPALLHGIYDTFCNFNIFGASVSFLTCVLSVVLLMTYLKNGKTYQSRLTKGVGVNENV